MLKNPETFRGSNDPVMKLMFATENLSEDLDLSNNEDDIKEFQRRVDELPPITPEPIEEGVYVVPSFNFDNLVGVRDFNMKYPNFPMDDGWFGSFGICDTPEQFMQKYGDDLKKDERTFVIGFCHVAKVPGERGGWRWHKWGSYVGEGEPKQEYLAEEEGFDDGVYVYSIIQIDGPDLNDEYSPFKKITGEKELKE